MSSTVRPELPAESVENVNVATAPAVQWSGVHIWTVVRYGSQYTWSVRTTDLTPQLLLAVPCPTCGVDAGKECILHAGGLRPDPHIDRKLDAAEAMEAKRTGTAPRG
jgi:hypothetical protein